MTKHYPTDQEKKNTEYTILYIILFLITLNMFAYGVRQGNALMYWCGTILCLSVVAMLFKTGYDHGWELKRIQSEEEE